MRIVVLGLALGLALACSKPAPRMDVGDPAAPALLAHVPADTPYLVASFEAIPISYWDKAWRALRPALSLFVNRTTSAADVARLLPVIAAVNDELPGGLTVANLERLGLSATPRYALYALDQTTFVLRLEIKDDAVLLATIARIAQRAKIALPASATRDGRRFWRVTPTPKIAVIVAAVDDQLVVAAGRVADVDRQLAMILGSTKPRASMAGGAALAEIRDRYGIGPHLLGFADIRRFLQAFAGFLAAEVSARCTREIERLAARTPRTVFGWRVTERESAGRLIIELPQDLVAQLTALQTDVPGFGLVVGDGPQITFGGGIDLERGRVLVLAAVQAMQRVTAACHFNPEAWLAEAEALLAEPVPMPWGGVRGVTFALHDIAFPPGGGVPSLLDLTVTVAEREPGAILDALPEIGGPAIARDGALHEVHGLALPYELHAGASAHALVLTTGPKGRTLGTQVLAAGPGTPAPLFAVNFDEAAWDRLERGVDRVEEGEEGEEGPADEALRADVQRSIDEARAKLYGRTRGTVTVEPAGLMVTWSTELR